MTYETLKGFTQFLKERRPVSIGTLSIAESLDQEISSDDVEDFRRANGQTSTNDIPSQSGFYWLCSDEGEPEIVKVIRGSDRISSILQGMSPMKSRTPVCMMILPGWVLWRRRDEDNV